MSKPKEEKEKKQPEQEIREEVLKFLTITKLLINFHISEGKL